MTAATSHVTATELALLNKPRHDWKWWLGKVGIFLGMTFIIIYCIAPFYWMVVSSLRLPTMGRDTSFWPNPVSFENYPAVFDPVNGFGRALVNSVIVSLSTTLVTLLFGILAAYALARLRFRFKGIVQAIIIG